MSLYPFWRFFFCSFINSFLGEPKRTFKFVTRTLFLKSTCRIFLRPFSYFSSPVTSHREQSSAKYYSNRTLPPKTDSPSEAVLRPDLKAGLQNNSLKRAVLLDIRVHVRLNRIKSALTVGLLLVFWFLTSWFLENLFTCFNTASLKMLTSYVSFPENCRFSQARFLLG